MYIEAVLSGNHEVLDFPFASVPDLKHLDRTRSISLLNASSCKPYATVNFIIRPLLKPWHSDGEKGHDYKTLVAALTSPSLDTFNIVMTVRETTLSRGPLPLNVLDSLVMSSTK